MSTLDAIAAARQRLSERLAKLDAERAKLADELAELAAAERVITRFTRARPSPRRARHAACGAAFGRGERGKKIIGEIVEPGVETALQHGRARHDGDLRHAEPGRFELCPIGRRRREIPGAELVRVEAAPAEHRGDRDE